MADFNEWLTSISGAQMAKDQADVAFEEATTKYREIEAAYRKVSGLELSGEARDTITSLLKDLLSRTAPLLAGGGIGTLITALAADDGAFGTITRLFGKIFGL